MIHTKKNSANAAIGTDPSVLKDIHDPAKNIAIYQRNIERLGQELHQLAEQSVEFRASGSIADILSQLRDYAEAALSPCPALIEDVNLQLNLFQKTTQSSTFRLLFATVCTNMCRKFHTDVNELRLLCTYFGPGTLWVPDDAIGQAASTSRETRGELSLDLTQVQQAGSGDVVLLKGALYPGANPILHRSPTIEENGDKRLLLRIDLNESLELLI
ncbi:MAG: DUF1826 domain-containing protein [Bacteroidota bacterium]